MRAWSPVPGTLGRRRVRAPVTLGALWEAERHSGNAPVWLAAALALGAVQYFTAAREIGWTAILAAVSVGLAVAFAGRRGAHGGMLLLPLAFALGMGAAKGEAARVDTGMMVGEATTRIEGRVKRVTVDDRGRTRYLVDVQTTRDPVLQHAPDRARLFVSAAHERLPVGSRIEALVRLRQPSGPSRPGGYDFAFHNYFEGLGAHGFVLGRPAMLAPPGTLTWGERVAALRGTIASIVRERLDGAAGGVAAALLTGNKRGIPEATTEALRAAGLAHVLAISGMHMALVAGLVLGAVRFGLSLHPTWSSSYPAKKIAATAALVLTSAYLAMSGGAVSAQRAHIMLCVMLLAVLLDRPAITMRNVGLAAIVVIAWRPHEVVGPGFQMSFGATAALVAVYGAWQRRPWRGAREPKLPTPLRRPLGFAVGLVVTSLVAGLATGVFAVHHFHRVATLGLLGNALAMPFVTLVVMPMAVLSALAMPFGLEAAPLWAMGVGIEAVLAAAEWVAALRPVIVTGALGTTAFALAAAALIVLTGLRTRLAWLGLVPLALAVPTMGRPTDALMVADRGELVAVRAEAGVAFARSRPNAFVARQWTDAAAATAIPANAAGGFECDAKDRLCTIEAHGLRIVSLRDVERLGEACDGGDVVVSDRRIRTERCRSGAFVLNARRTGERGAATIDLAALSALASTRDGTRSALRDVPTETILAHVTHAIPAAPRPWTANRHAVIVRRPRASAATASGDIAPVGNDLVEALGTDAGREATSDSKPTVASPSSGADRPRPVVETDPPATRPSGSGE